MAAKDVQELEVSVQHPDHIIKEDLSLLGGDEREGCVEWAAHSLHLWYFFTHCGRLLEII